MLAIEVDGESHYGNIEKDGKKDRRLNELGVTVLRFDDLDIVYKLDKVIEKIEEWIDENEKLTSTPKSPPRRGLSD